MVRWRLDPGQIEVVDDAVAAILRQKTPEQRLEMMFAANRMMRQMLQATIADEHPEWSPSEVLREVARRMSRGSG
jgi:hypothetical protein